MVSCRFFPDEPPAMVLLHWMRLKGIDPSKKAQTRPSIMPRIAQFSLVLPVVELHPGVNVDLRQQGYVVQFCLFSKQKTNKQEPFQ